MRWPHLRSEPLDEDTSSIQTTQATCRLGLSDLDRRSVFATSSPDLFRLDDLPRRRSNLLGRSGDDFDLLLLDDIESDRRGGGGCE